MADFITAEQRTELVKLYIAYFNRAPESDGLDFHSRALLADINAGLSVDQALQNRADAFFEAALIQSEFTGYTAGQTVEEFVAKVYSNVLLRPGEGGDAPPAAEIGYWVNELAAGNVTPRGLVVAFLDAQQVLIAEGTTEEVERATKVKEIIEARIKVALEFAKPEISGDLRGADAHDAGVAALAGVVDDATADARIDELGGLVNAGDTFTLTTGQDNPAATSGNDTFLGLVGTGATLTLGDLINGGAGTDTLKLFSDSASVN